VITTGVVRAGSFVVLLGGVVWWGFGHVHQLNGARPMHSIVWRVVLAAALVVGALVVAVRLRTRTGDSIGLLRFGRRTVGVVIDQLWREVKMPRISPTDSRPGRVQHEVRSSTIGFLDLQGERRQFRVSSLIASLSRGQVVPIIYDGRDVGR
jgi:hypothetical protein